MDKSADFTEIGTPILQSAIARIRRNYATFDGQFPAYGDQKTAYLLTPNKNWLASFWSGLLWLVAHRTKDIEDIHRADALLPTFQARLDQNIRLNHDIGFLFTLSARASWQINNNDNAYHLALRAADVLYARFRHTGAFIQAWGDVDDKDENGRFIIDCMMNLPLLFWATRETGNAQYRDVAVSHALTSAQYLMRDDGSTYHTYFLNATTGDPIGPRTHQGHGDDSVWSRGQAWAIYGFAMAAEWTGEHRFRTTACAAADWYLNAIDDKSIAPWDFKLPANTPTIPDSSADAIAAGGLLRLSRLTGDTRYKTAAIDRITLLIDQAFDNRPEAQGLFLHGTQHKPHDYGVDTYTIFGDYFALETILNLLYDAPDFWGPNTK